MQHNDLHVFLLSDKAMKVLLSCLESKVMETRCMGASAVWALLHNNQRVRTCTGTCTCTGTHARATVLKLYFSVLFIGGCFEFTVDPYRMKSSACLILCLQDTFGRKLRCSLTFTADDQCFFNLLIINNHNKRKKELPSSP